MVDVKFDGRVVCDEAAPDAGALLSLKMELLFSSDEDPGRAVDYASDQLKKAIARIREEKIMQELDAPVRKLNDVFGDLAGSGYMRGVRQ